jgi:hypothetical protein
MAGTSPRNPEPVDWSLLRKRLYLTAVSLVGGPKRGDSDLANDLVSQAVTQFFSSPNGLGWDGTSLGLTKLLIVVVKRRYIDQVRREKKLTKEDPDKALAQIVSCSLGQSDDQIAGEELKCRLFAAVAGHPKEKELRDFITAAGIISSTSFVDHQLAEMLSTEGNTVTVGEVRNRRKMLRRIISIEDIRKATATRAK